MTLQGAFLLNYFQWFSRAYPHRFGIRCCALRPDERTQSNLVVYYKNDRMVYCLELDFGVFAQSKKQMSKIDTTLTTPFFVQVMQPHMLRAMAAFRPHTLLGLCRAPFAAISARGDKRGERPQVLSLMRVIARQYDVFWLSIVGNSPVVSRMSVESFKHQTQGMIKHEYCAVARLSHFQQEECSCDSH